MLILSLAYGLFTIILFAIVAWRADRRYRTLAAVPPIANDAFPLPAVAIVVPARNEAANIERVATSLLALQYPDATVTIVDDHSSDDTATRARAAGAQVIRLDCEPPPGWTGKCHACDQGAVAATDADWLLFTDADTFHDPDSLSRAIVYAESNRLDALSLLLRQECVTVWDRAILPLAYQQYFAAFRADRPVFNGQYILIRREVYVQSGGFGAVRGKVMEDVAFAEALNAQGYRIALANGEAMVGVRMYADLPALWRGLTKTAFTAARDQGSAGWLLGGLTFVGVGLALGMGLALIGGAWPIVGVGALAWLFNVIVLLPWLWRFAVQPAIFYALLNIPALCVLWLIGMVSTFRALFGRGVRWKGRTIIEDRAASVAETRIAPTAQPQHRHP